MKTIDVWQSKNSNAPLPRSPILHPLSCSPCQNSHPSPLLVPKALDPSLPVYPLTLRLKSFCVSLCDHKVDFWVWLVLFSLCILRSCARSVCKCDWRLLIIDFYTSFTSFDSMHSPYIHVPFHPWLCVFLYIHFVQVNVYSYAQIVIYISIHS